MGLAATSAGLRLLIERATEDQLGAGASIAFVGGILLAFIATRIITVSSGHRLGVSLKLGTMAVLLAVLAAEGLLPPVALAAAVALVLATLVFLERTLFPDGAAL
jgi:low temperature requirement protein LtrA